MRCVQVTTERQLRLTDVAEPEIRQPDDVRVRVAYCALNRLDLFSIQGMPFAHQALPLIAGAEASGIVDAVGAAVTDLTPGERVVVYPGLVCFDCPRCRAGRENLCERPLGIRGFHADGVAAERVVVPRATLIRVPDGLGLDAAACAPVGVATVVHMLGDNARLERGETILVQAAGSGIGTVAVSLAKHLGAQVIATVGSAEKAERARALGVDHVIRYDQESVPRAVRKLTARRGVDVVFEHVGASTWDGSILSMAKGARLVICGSHSGTYGRLNLVHLFNQHLKILASFGSSIANVGQALDLLTRGDVKVVIDSELPLERFEEGVERLRDRKVFGKVIYRCS